MANCLQSLRKILLVISSLSAIVLWRYNYLTLDRKYSLKNIHPHDMSRNESAKVNRILHQNNNMMANNDSFRILPKCTLDFDCKPPSKCQHIQYIQSFSYIASYMSTHVSVLQILLQNISVPQ